MLLVVGLLAGISTTLGGLLAIRFKDKLHIILGFSAGAVVGVALFELLPEAIELGEANYSISTITALVAVGFLAYTFMDRWLLLHGHTDTCEQTTHHGEFGAASLILHSTLDGIAIGLAFHISESIGIAIAIAVLTHDFSDGINTVGIVLRQKGQLSKVYLWLALDALAPLIGIGLTYLVDFSESGLGVVLAIFTGFFLSIGASDLVPESHHAHPKIVTTLMTMLGALTIFVVSQFAV